MQQLSCQLAGLPLQLVLLYPSGEIGITKHVQKFPAIFDDDNNVLITDECLVVYGKTFQYNIAFSMTEKLKKWLISLRLEQPW